MLPIGFASGAIPSVPMNLPLLKNYSIVGVYWGAWAERFPQASVAADEQLFEWVAQGKLKPHVERYSRWINSRQLWNWCRSERLKGVSCFKSGNRPETRKRCAHPGGDPWFTTARHYRTVAVRNVTERTNEHRNFPKGGMGMETAVLDNAVRGRLNAWCFDFLESYMHRKYAAIKSRLLAEVPPVLVELGPAPAPTSDISRAGPG